MAFSFWQYRCRVSCEKRGVGIVFELFFVKKADDDQILVPNEVQAS
jgi:hypothetical protein